MYHDDLFPSSLSDEDVANLSFPIVTTPPDRELYPEVSGTYGDIDPHPIGVTATHRTAITISGVV